MGMLYNANQYDFCFVFIFPGKNRSIKINQCDLKNKTKKTWLFWKLGFYFF